MKKSRREFIKDSVVASAIGIGAAKFGMLRATLAAAKMQGKQPLSERNLNSIIPKNSDELTNWIKGPTGDFKGWVREKFTLSADQEQGLNSLTTANINKIKDALRQAAANKAKLSVVVDMPTSNSKASSNAAARSRTTEPTNPAPTTETPERETTVEVEATSFPPSVKVKVSCKRKAVSR
jgi:hypothetical protein